MGNDTDDLGRYRKGMRRFMRKRKKGKQVRNYLTFVAAGILLVIIVVLVSGL